MINFLIVRTKIKLALLIHFRIFSPRQLAHTRLSHLCRHNSHHKQGILYPLWSTRFLTAWLDVMTTSLELLELFSSPTKDFVDEFPSASIFVTVVLVFPSGVLSTFLVSLEPSALRIEMIVLPQVLECPCWL